MPGFLALTPATQWLGQRLDFCFFAFPPSHYFLHHGHDDDDDDEKNYDDDADYENGEDAGALLPGDNWFGRKIAAEIGRPVQSGRPVALYSNEVQGVPKQSWFLNFYHLGPSGEPWAIWATPGHLGNPGPLWAIFATFDHFGPFGPPWAI